MSLNAITAAALQAAQRIPSSLEGGIPAGLRQSSGADFGQTLASQIQGQANAISQPTRIDAAQPTNFQGLAIQMVRDTEHLQSAANHAVKGVLSGQPGASLHSAMIAMEEASVSFQMLTEMRNKIVESLQELMRMQI